MRLAGVRSGDMSEILDATLGDEEQAPQLSKPSVEPYDPLRYHDATRSYIAYWLLAILTLLVIGGFALPFWTTTAIPFANLKSVLDLVFGPIVALVSSVTGFYFGSQQAARKEPSK